MPTHTPNLALRLAPSSAGLRARPEPDQVRTLSLAFQGQKILPECWNNLFPDQTRIFINII